MFCFWFHTFQSLTFWNLKWNIHLFLVGNYGSVLLPHQEERNGSLSHENMTLLWWTTSLSGSIKKCSHHIKIFSGFYDIQLFLWLQYCCKVLVKIFLIQVKRSCYNNNVIMWRWDIFCFSCMAALYFHREQYLLYNSTHTHWQPEKVFEFYL